MEQSQYDQLVDALNAAADTVVKRRPTELALGMYWKTLEQYELGAVLSGIALHMQDTEAGMFMPKPADIIKQIEGGGDERSLLAWTKLERGVTQVGSWRTLAFDDPRIHAVIEDMGGWMVFCSATGDDWPFLRNEFCKRFRGYVRRPPTSYPALIRGEGKTDEPPVLIGIEHQAEQVMLFGSENSRGMVAITDQAKQVEKNLIEKVER